MGIKISSMSTEQAKFPVEASVAVQPAPARSPLRIGLRTPPWRPIPEVVKFAKLGERLGFDLISLSDSPMLWRDTMCTLTVLALETERVTLSTSVTNPVHRTPVSLASTVRTIAELAPGRFRLGLATGDSAVLLANRKPATVDEYREAVRIIRELLEGRAPFENAPDTTLYEPCGHVPIWVAASGPRMLKTAGELGDGFISNNKDLVAKRKIVRAAAEAAGRPMPPHQIGVEVRLTNDIERDARQLKPFIAKHIQRDGGQYLESQGFKAVVPDRNFKLPDGTDLAHPRDLEAAIEIASQWISDELAMWFAQNLVIWGDADHITQRLVGLWELGIDEVLTRINGAYAFPEKLAHDLAEHGVLERVRAATRAVPAGGERGPAAGDERHTRMAATMR
jgi:5,10-methylenetetrahydromethanopterin reductase